MHFSQGSDMLLFFSSIKKVSEENKIVSLGFILRMFSCVGLRYAANCIDFSCPCHVPCVPTIISACSV